MKTISERIARVRGQIAEAATRTGRDGGSIRLVGVSKTHPPELVYAALEAGLADFGENRVQEAEEKIAALATQRARLRWHLIGHLQSNKARRAAALFDLVHSLDSLGLAQALDRHAGERRAAAGLTPRLDVLLQVNVSGEASKQGFELAQWERDPARLERFCAEVAGILALPHLRVRGLMTIAPWHPDPAAAAATFRSARQLRDALAERFPAAAWGELSMGMSDDLDAAVAEGATMVRVGRAIFGERD